MREEVQAHPLATGKIGALIVRFALPSVVSMLVGALYNIVDQMFIGHVVGPVGNAATNVDFPLPLLALAAGLLFGIGGAAGFSLSLGRGQPEKAVSIVGSAVFWLTAAGLFLAAVTRVFLFPALRLFGANGTVMPFSIAYTGVTCLGLPFLVLSTGLSALIRADGRPGYAMLCQVTGCLVNTALDAVFMLSFGMGIAGAAWATVIGQFVSCVMALCYLPRFHQVRLTRGHVRPQKSVTGSILSLGMAACFNQLAMAVVQVVMNRALTRYGAQSVYGSETALAVSGIISKVNMIFLSVVIGIAQGCQPIIGFNYGAKNYTRVRETYRKALTAALILSAMGFLCFQLWPRQIIGLFGSGDESYFAFAERYFRLFLFMAFLSGIQPVTANFFTSIGKAVKGLFLSLTRQILFLCPLILILPLFLGIDGILYAGPVSDAAMAALAMTLIARETRGMKAREKDGRASP